MKRTVFFKYLLGSDSWRDRRNWKEKGMTCSKGPELENEHQLMQICRLHIHDVNRAINHLPKLIYWVVIWWHENPVIGVQTTSDPCFPPQGAQFPLYFIMWLKSFKIHQTMLRIFNESVVPSAIFSAEVANNSKLNKPNLKQEDCIQVTGNIGLLLPLCEVVVSQRSVFNKRLPWCTTKCHMKFFLLELIKLFLIPFSFLFL